MVYQVRDPGPQTGLLEVTWRRQYGVIVVVLMLIGLSLSVIYLAYKVHGNGNTICSELQVFSSTPAIRPSDPARHPAQEELWKDYINAVKLKQKLKCS